MKKNIISENIDYLKRQAKKVKKEQGISHHAALDLIAKGKGFENWKTLIRELNSSSSLEQPSQKEVITLGKSKNNNLKIDPYRNLLIGATNLLLEKGLVSLSYKDEYQENEKGHIFVQLLNYPSVIIWRNIGYGELSISVWWKYNHDKYLQANLEGNYKENFRTSKPLADKRHYKKFVGVVASCWLERKEGKHLQGKGRENIFDIYTRKGEKEILEKLPLQKPIGYKPEGKWYF